MRKPFLLILLCIPCAATRSPLYAQDPDDGGPPPQAVLRAHGLYPANGHEWVTQSELTVRRAAAELEMLERKHQQAIARANDMLAANEAIRGRLAHTEAVEAAQNPSTANRATEPIAAESEESHYRYPTKPAEKLHSTLPDVTGLGEQTPLQRAMIELVNARANLQLAVRTLLDQSPRLTAAYQHLAREPAIVAALRQMGDKARLGPLRDYHRERQRAQALAASCFRPEVPGYFEAGQFRVPALLSNRHPVTFSLISQSGPVVLTASAAQRLGITPQDGTGTEGEIEILGRRVKAKPTKIKTMRLGATVAEDIPAVILPAEAEDLGSFLPTDGLPGLSLQLLPRRMLLQVRSDKSP